MPAEQRSGQPEGSLTTVFGHSILKDLAEIVSHNEAWEALGGKVESEVKVKWYAGEFIHQVLPRARLYGSRLFDQVLPQGLREKMYDPFYSDHDVNHSFRVTQNGKVHLIFDPRVRSLDNYQDKIDVAISLGAIWPDHDCLQVDSTLPERKRLGHDQIGGRFFIPGLMWLGNLLGKTTYTDRQIALAAYAVANHELESKTMKMVDFSRPAELIKSYEKIFGKSLTEVYPSLGQLEKSLAAFGVNLWSLELDFSHITELMAELVRGHLTAADVRDQVAPPSFAALRAIKAIPGRQYLSLSKQITDYYTFVDRIVDGYNPESKDFEDDTLRAAYETCRSFEDTTGLTPFAQSWLRYSQLKRGNYHIKFAKDMVLISRHNLKATTLFSKSLELTHELQKELWLEYSEKTEELTKALTRIAAMNFDDLNKVIDGRLDIRLANPYMRKIGIYVLRQFSSQAVSLLNKYILMTKQPGFSPSDFVSRVEKVMSYAQQKSRFFTTVVPREILDLKMKKLTVDYSNF
ncbi:MAG: hypothetical protein NTZ93_04715 [Candidatus Beckwithbacteria bacterium]|nr:hypothetical protein [Candidatus Beckwithbacteria bacterium]